MSIARHHAEWSSLVEVSGPFLSLPVLMRAYPQGLEDVDPTVAQQLRSAYEEWQEDLGHRSRAVPTHLAWVGYVLRAVLELPDDAIAEGQAIPGTLKASVPELGETLRPTHVVRDPADGKPRLLVAAYPPDQHLERPALGKRWKASPATRMTELLHATGVRLGLVTNGEQWMLVDAPRDDTAGFTSWYAELWLEERLTLRAFRGLLGARRFFGVAAADTLEALLAESAQNQQEVTDQLGYQVRRAVEVLVSALDRADQDHGRKLLAGVPEPEVYEAALTVMMRLVFLFCAEERDLLLLGDPLFDEHYAVSPLREQLRQAADQHGEEVLERRHDAWCRLLATFRAVHGGVRHERMTIPPYGGRLFDPDRFPFLEGRKHGTAWRASTADPLPVSNRTVLHLLEALQLLQVKVPGGGSAEARRLSFRALDIEQIGHVYEGLLDHTAKRAAEVTLGLAGSRDKTRDFEPEVALSQLEALATKGGPALVEYLTEESRRSAKAIEKALGRPLTAEEEQRLQVACGGGDDGKALLARVRPFGGLIRLDTLGHPVLIHGGSIYVTEGTDRRSTGTQYTPRSLAEPVVQHALEPLVYEGPAEGKPREQWKLRSVRELLALAICDFACGSGAFLVQACRYLAARLLEAWEAVEREHPGLVRITPEGDLSKGLPEERLIPKDPDERLTYAMRLVAQRCLYGVDVNPLAVEMAKLSMWLLTLAKEKPFTFLDHSIRCGDSLLGITTLDQLKRFSLAEGPVQQRLSQQVAFDDLVDRAVAARLRIETMGSDTIDQVAAQKGLLADAEEQMGRLKAAAYQLIAAELGDVSPDEAIRHATAALVSPDLAGVIGNPVPRSQRRRPFHWPLEFPEVMVKRGGFNAFVGNPPFMGGSRITGVLGSAYRDYLVEHVAGGIGGRVDLCTYFYLQAYRLLRSQGSFGLLATNSVAQGDARLAGLDSICKNGGSIYKAVSTYRWPGSASVSVAIVWLRRGVWSGASNLDGHSVARISTFLTEQSQDKPGPERLRSNAKIAFRGTEVRGEGFVLSPAQANQLLKQRPENRDVLFPYMSGEDLNSTPDQSPTRWVINFHDWSWERASQYPECLRILTEKVRPYRETITKQIHEADYWKFWDKRLAEYAKIAGMKRVLATAAISPTNAMAWVRPGIVFQNKLVIFALEQAWVFAVLQSSIHWEWVRYYTSTLGSTTLNYSPTDCFETFPFPWKPSLVAANSDSLPLERIGDAYDAQRTALMLDRSVGLTKCYNLLHRCAESAADVVQLRALHKEMDEIVAVAYGWVDVDLAHGLQETKQGVRFTIGKEARRVILDRLLQLNHERYAEEVRQGLHIKGRAAKPGSRKKKEDDELPGLFS